MSSSSYIKTKLKTVLIVILVLIEIFSFSGCNEILQELATDFVQVVINHELQNESYKNQQIYTYTISVRVANNYFLDLNDASIELNVPEGVSIITGNRILKDTIDCNTEEYYGWVITVEPGYEDKNVEISVTVSSAEVSGVTAYDSIFIEGINENDNRLDFTVDTWNFENFSGTPIPITQDDYYALCFKLSETEKADIRQHITGGANGHCFGMAITTVLAKSNRIEINRLEEGASNLHGVSKNKISKSAIAYYYLTQFTTPVMDKIVEYINKDSGEKLDLLIELSENVEKGGNPVLFCFYLKDAGHAVVAFANEKCRERFDGITYWNRILIYDNNFPDDYEYLYYNNSDEWIIVCKDDNDKNYQPYETEDFGLITANMEEIDPSNIEQNRKSVNSYLTSRDNSELQLSSENINCEINGTDVIGSSEVVAFYDIDSIDEANLNIAIKRGEAETAYSVQSQKKDNPLDISILYDKYFICANAEGDDKVNLSPSGSVDIEGKTTDFSLSITANKEYAPLEWTTLTVDGKKADNPKLEITGDGYLLSGDSLKNVTVVAENEDSANKLSFSTGGNQVLITQTGNDLCAKTDKDDDGEYETILATGVGINPDNPTNGGPDDDHSPKPGNSGSVDLWVILLIAGVVLVAIIVVVIVILSSGKNKDKDDDSENPYYIKDQRNESLAEKDNRSVDTSTELEDITTGIQILSGSMTNKKFRVDDGKTSVIGKDPKFADIVLDSSYTLVSRVHCTVNYSAAANKYFVIDSSSNGTYYENGTRLQKGTRTPVVPGTVLKLANDNCKIKLM